MGRSCVSTPGFPKNYRVFAAFFVAPLAAFFAIVFSSGSCGPASTSHATRHNWWAEPAALIPDVDYERGRNAVKHKSAEVVKNFDSASTPNLLTPVKSGSSA